MYPYSSITVLIPLVICVLQDMHAHRGEQWCSKGASKKHTDDSQKMGAESMPLV